VVQFRVIIVAQIPNSFFLHFSSLISKYFRTLSHFLNDAERGSTNSKFLGLYVYHIVGLHSVYLTFLTFYLLESLNSLSHNCMSFVKAFLNTRVCNPTLTKTHYSFFLFHFFDSQIFHQRGWRFTCFLLVFRLSSHVCNSSSLNPS